MLKFFITYFVFFGLPALNSYAISPTVQNQHCDLLVKTYVRTWKQHNKIALDIQNGVYTWNSELQESYIKMLFQLGDRLTDMARDIERFQCNLPDDVLI